jgi:hypothetical protein
MNSPRLFNRAGLQSHIVPWSTLTAPLGNNIEVSFIFDYKIIHGGSATLFAIGKHPEELKDIRPIVFPQSISANMSSTVTL